MSDTSWLDDHPLAPSMGGIPTAGVPTDTAWLDAHPNAPSTGNTGPQSFWQNAKDYGSGMMSPDYGRGILAGAATVPMGLMQNISHGIESLVPPAPGVAPASKQVESGQAYLNEAGSQNYDRGRTIGPYLGAAGMAALVPGLGGTGVGGAMLNGAAQGAVLGASQPQNPDTYSGSQFAQNVGTSALTDAAASGALRTFFPGPSAAVQQLRAAGVQPTPGVTAGGLPRTLEDIASQIPLLGQPIKSGRQAALDQFTNATSGGATLPNVLPSPAGGHGLEGNVMEWGPKLALIEEAARHLTEPGINYAMAHPGLVAGMSIPSYLALQAINSNPGRAISNTGISGLAGILSRLGAPMATQGIGSNWNDAYGILPMLGRGQQ